MTGIIGTNHACLGSLSDLHQYGNFFKNSDILAKPHIELLIMNMLKFLVCYEFIMSDKPSAAWYLAPIFLGIIGSAIMWYVLKDENHPDSPKMIKKGWVIGIVLTVISFAWMPFMFLPMMMM